MPQREKDIPSQAIGTPEPTGRTRGVGNLATWGKAFVGDGQEARRQRKRAKQERLKEEITEEVTARFEAKLHALEERLSSQTIRETGPHVSQGGHPSSCASDPDEPSPIDALNPPAQCTMTVDGHELFDGRCVWSGVSFSPR